MTWTSCGTGAMTEVFGGIRAPSTLGSFLRSFSWGNVRQLDAVARQFLSALAAGTPLLPGAGVLAFIDMDSMQKRVYGLPGDVITVTRCDRRDSTDVGYPPYARQLPRGKNRSGPRRASDPGNACSQLRTPAHG